MLVAACAFRHANSADLIGHRRHMLSQMILKCWIASSLTVIMYTTSACIHEYLRNCYDVTGVRSKVRTGGADEKRLAQQLSTAPPEILPPSTNWLVMNC